MSPTPPIAGVTKFTPACKKCGEPLSPIAPVCLNCRRLQQRYYLNTKERRDRAAYVRFKAKQRLKDEGLKALLDALLAQQDGRCGCCDKVPSGRLSIDWHETATDGDDGPPMLRGLICKSCKTMVNRALNPKESKFGVPATVMDVLVTYMARPLRSPFAPDLLGKTFYPPAEPVEPSIALSRSMAAWFQGGMQGPMPMPPKK